MTLLLLLRTNAASGSYTLTADTATFSLTGNAAGLPVARKLTADTANYTLTGNAAGIRLGYRLTAATATFSLTGNAVNLKASRVLVAAPASYTLTGNAAILRAGRKLVTATASYTLTGINAALKADRKLAAGTGAFTLTGNDADLVRPGAYVLTAETASYILIGTDTALTYTPAEPEPAAGTPQSIGGKPNKRIPAPKAEPSYEEPLGTRYDGIIETILAKRAQSEEAQEQASSIDAAPEPAKVRQPVFQKAGLREPPPRHSAASVLAPAVAALESALLDATAQRLREDEELAIAMLLLAA